MESGTHSDSNTRICIHTIHLDTLALHILMEKELERLAP
jgi:hypothetical protein